MNKTIVTRRIISHILATALLIACLIASIRLASSPVEAASLPETERPPAFVAKLKPLLEAQMKQLQVPGAIIFADLPGQGSWTTAMGTSNLTTEKPMNVKSAMRIGSITKTFTATVILQFSEEGKLRLDDPVSHYLPGVPNGTHITIRELLNMTSGLFNYSEDTSFIQELIANPARAWTPQELLAFAFNHPPYFPPGEGWYYANTNYILLGLIIERISGQPAEKVIQQRVFRPLHMFRTSLPPRSSSKLPDPHPQGYIPITSTSPFLDVTDWNPSWAWTAGSAISTLHDLKIWARALATGTLLHPSTQRERLDWIQISATVGYGLGVANFGGLIGHNGSIPGFQSFMGYEPARGETIIVLTNLSSALDGSPPADTLAGIIAQELGSANTKNMRLQTHQGTFALR